MVTLQLPSPVRYPPVPAIAAFRDLAVRETTPTGPPKPRLLDRVRLALQARHWSRRTEKTYVAWIRRYILFHGQRHPAEMGAAEITQFLSSLAVERNVAASTQNQALSALLFLYRHVLEQELPWPTGWSGPSGPSDFPSCSRNGAPEPMGQRRVGFADRGSPARSAGGVS